MVAPQYFWSTSTKPSRKFWSSQIDNASVLHTSPILLPLIKMLISYCVSSYLSRAMGQWAGADRRRAELNVLINKVRRIQVKWQGRKPKPPLPIKTLLVCSLGSGAALGCEAQCCNTRITEEQTTPEQIPSQGINSVGRVTGAT